jgi:hypothetical protein
MLIHTLFAPYLLLNILFLLLIILFTFRTSLTLSRRQRMMPAIKNFLSVTDLTRGILYMLVHEWNQPLITVCKG